LSGVPAPRALAILKKNVLGLGPSLIALALLLHCLAQLLPPPPAQEGDPV
jgi:hypothetical protein